MNTAKLVLTQEWDKCFPKSDKVEHSKVTFANHFGITLAADLYVPKNAQFSCLRRVRSCQGTAFRPVCADDG